MKLWDKFKFLKFLKYTFIKGDISWILLLLKFNVTKYWYDTDDKGSKFSIWLRLKSSSIKFIAGKLVNIFMLFRLQPYSTNLDK